MEKDRGNYLKKLFIIFDFNSWAEAKSWSYVSGYLIIEEMIQAGEGSFDLVSIPFDYSEDQVLKVIMPYLDSNNYDHIVIWLPHLRISKKTSNKILEKKLGITYFVTESLVYRENEIRLLPHLQYRLGEFLDHYIQEGLVICFCKETSDELNKLGVNVLFKYGYLPHNKITPRNQKNRVVSYAAVLYNDERIAIHDNLNKILIEKLNYCNIVINDSDVLKSKFDIKINEIKAIDRSYADAQDFHIKRGKLSLDLLLIRKEIWKNYLETISSCEFIINLPSFFKGLPGRVLEAIYTGVPCLSINSNLSCEQNSEIFSNGIMSLCRFEDLNDKFLNELRFQPNEEFLKMKFLYKEEVKKVLGY